MNKVLISIFISLKIVFNILSDYILPIAIIIGICLICKSLGKIIRNLEDININIINKMDELNHKIEHINEEIRNK